MRYPRITRANVHGVLAQAEEHYASAQIANGQRYASALQPGANFQHRALINARSNQCTRLLHGTEPRHKLGSLPKHGVRVCVRQGNAEYQGRVVWLPKERAYCLDNALWLRWSRRTVKSQEWVNGRPHLTVTEWED